MKSRTFTCITAMVLFVGLVIPIQLAAPQTRYKVIDVGTLGGPNSSTGFEASPSNALSSQGVFTACAAPARAICAELSHSRHRIAKGLVAASYVNDAGAEA